MDFSGKDGPGPGEYEPYRESQNKIEHVNLRESDKARFEARIPRYHEMVVHQEEKKVGVSIFRVPTAQGKWPKKIPVRENTDNLEILPKPRKNTGNLVCSSCRFPDSKSVFFRT